MTKKGEQPPSKNSFCVSNFNQENPLTRFGHACIHSGLILVPDMEGKNDNKAALSKFSKDLGYSLHESRVRHIKRAETWSNNYSRLQMLGVISRPTHMKVCMYTLLARGQVHVLWCKQFFLVIFCASVSGASGSAFRSRTTVGLAFSPDNPTTSLLPRQPNH